MKILFPLVFIWLCVTFFCIAEEQSEEENKVLLVKMCDRTKSISYQTMTPTEYNSLQNEIKAETKLHAKALAITQKAWRADEETAKKPFPGSAISLRQAMVIGPSYTDMDKADAKLEYYEKKMEEERKKDKEKQEQQDKAKGKSSDMIQRDKQKTAERELYNMKARQLYESKLAELMNPPEEKKEEKQEKKKE